MKQILMKQVIDGLEIRQGTFDAPVGRNLPCERSSFLEPIHFLPVERCGVHEFLVHHIGDHGGDAGLWASKAVGVGALTIVPSSSFPHTGQARTS